MRLYTISVLLGVLLLGIQAHPFLPFAQQGIRPDLVFILVLYLGTRTEIARGPGALLATLLGYFCGAFSGGPLGLYAFIYLFFFVAVDLLKNVFDYTLFISRCCWWSFAACLKAYWFFSCAGVFSAIRRCLRPLKILSPNSWRSRLRWLPVFCFFCAP